MDFTEIRLRKPNPCSEANSVSKLLFLWLIPLFRKGYKEDLNIEDLWEPLKGDLSSMLGDKLERQWNKQLELQKEKGIKPKLFKALWGVLGWDYVMMVLAFAFPELVFRVAQPLILRELLLSLTEGGRVSQTAQYLLAGGVCLVTFAISITFHPSCQLAYVLAMRCRLACSSMIYRKALRLSKAAQGQSTVGQITNLLANDVNRFDLNLLYTAYIPLGILQTILFTVFLWKEFRYACLTGLGIILLMMPIQYWNGRLSAVYRLQIAQRTDERGRIMNEIIIAMRIIKQYAWEKPFSAVIDKLRKYEVEALTKRLYMRGFYLSMFMSTMKLVVFSTVLTYVLQGNQPTADKVFFLSSVFFTMIQSVVYLVPSAISGIGEISVSLLRMENFLNLEEKNKEDEHLTIVKLPTSKHKEEDKVAVAANALLSPKWKTSTRGNETHLKPGVILDSVSATWTGEKMNLDDINLKAEGDKIVMVVGSVGSGKTSLLHVLLGELPIAKGKCRIQGTISYASQEPWIFAGNVKQNILFGKEFISERYESVVKAAALEDDFKQLEFGDQTIVGERGVSLSGGQKARVNLARALYQEADIYLLDDPLSAVDTRVSLHLFEKCIRDHLRGKLRILVTHQLQYLPQANHIIILNEAKVVAQGSYGQLVEAGVDFVTLISSEDDKFSLSRKSSTVESVSSDMATYDSYDKIDLAKLELRKNLQSEKKATGSVGLGVVWDYLKGADAPMFLAFVFVIFFFCQVCLTGSDFWLSYWTNGEAEHYRGNDEHYLGRNIYIFIFAGLVGGVILFNFLRAVSFFTYCMRISVRMHNNMFSSLVRSPSKFFDDNPSGRILNRFTKDIGSMDELLPPTLFDMIIVFSNVAGVFVIIIISNYYAAVPTVVVLVILGVLQRYYVATARDVKRIEGVTKSPVFTHSSATFHGLTTIRSANAEPILIKQFDNLQDIHTASWFIFISSTRSFGIWVETISAVYLAFVSFGFLLLQNATNSSNFGLAITSAMTVSGWLQFGMRQSAEVENLMTSVERNLEYAKLTPEAPLESSPGKKPASNWPTSGAIRLCEVYLAYEEKDVLNDLSFEIKPKEKIGIVGRTGAGKSSIIQALFRLTEPRGNIFIDDVNIKEIGLHDLRKNISIIPQDPILFSGTVRYNLDPFSEFPDDALWRVIEEVELKNAIPALDYLVADQGSNFSLGQRQLICLARAVLRKNLIIVMDEATANVDIQTDNLIQTTIRTKFADCSIITVAHRLNSVIDCDKILVLDNGYLKEYDHPHILLQNPKGMLTAMVEHTGKSSEDMLRKIAAETYSKKRGSFQAEAVIELSAVQRNNDANE